MAKRRPLSHAERGRLGGLARAKKHPAAKRRADARKAGLANADRLARLKALEDALEEMEASRRLAEMTALGARLAAEASADPQQREAGQ